MAKFRVIETEFADQLLEYRGRDVATPVLAIDSRHQTVSVDTRFAWEARSFAEDSGEVAVFEIPMLSGKTADKLMYEIAELVCDGDSEEATVSIIDRYEADLEYYFADDWFSGHSRTLAAAMGITPETTDEELLDLCRIEELAAGGIIIGCAEYLEDLRDALRKDRE